MSNRFWRCTDILMRTWQCCTQQRWLSLSNTCTVMASCTGSFAFIVLAQVTYFSNRLGFKSTIRCIFNVDFGLIRIMLYRRDLKPDNMLVAADGHLKLTDFGLSTVTLRRGKCDSLNLYSRAFCLICYFHLIAYVYSYSTK
jgi:serine/threonine protein kinase